MSSPPLPLLMFATDDSHPLIRIRADAIGEVVDTEALAWPATATPVPRDPAAARRAQPADFLLPVAKRWLASLPPAVRPRALAQRFPRLVNRFAAAWDDEPGLALVFSDLLLDHRGNRQGFPSAVKADLHRLWRHWQREREAGSVALAG